jgi:uncharacterized repeat protein (TIGR04076 family)
MSDPVENDGFELFDLRVEAVVPPGATVYCGARDKDFFELRGEMLSLPPGQSFSIYSIAAVTPFLAAKQRPTHPNDWMTSDAEIACPDPNCPSRLRITRLGLRRFSHRATTAVALPKRLTENVRPHPEERPKGASRRARAARVARAAHPSRLFAAQRAPQDEGSGTLRSDSEEDAT